MGEKTSNVRLQGLEHIIQFTVCDGKIHFRSYRTKLKKSCLKTPRVELEEIGPSLDLILRRTRLASDDVMKEALKQPKTLKPKKIKNISHDNLGEKAGRIHMQKQDLGKLQTRKMKGLKRKSSDQTKGAGESRKKNRTDNEPL